MPDGARQFSCENSDLIGQKVPDTQRSDFAKPRSGERPGTQVHTWKVKGQAAETVCRRQGLGSRDGLGSANQCHSVLQCLQIYAGTQTSSPRGRDCVWDFSAGRSI
jgi:hypothetical protein